MYVLLVATLISEVVAQSYALEYDEIIHSEVDISERTSAGKLEGCELTFVAAFPDFTYRSGDPAAIRGSVAVLGSGGASRYAVLALKVGLFDIEKNTGSLAEASVDYSYLETGSVSSAGRESTKFECEDMGLCVGYSLFEMADLFAAGFPHEFHVVFNRRPGGTDIRVPFAERRRDASLS